MTTSKSFRSSTGVDASNTLRTFCLEVENCIDAFGNTERCAHALEPALRQLVMHDNWLGAAWEASDTGRYQQHPLYIGRLERCSVVSFVWGPGQSTPIHDHGAWGVVGVLRGAEHSQRYQFGNERRFATAGPKRRLDPGDTELLLPSAGDIHRVGNAVDNQISISIHVYGTNIGKVERHAYDPNGSSRVFVSGYSATTPAFTCLDP